VLDLTDRSAGRERYSEVLAARAARLNQHIGQRKLLMSEIEFLTLYYQEEAQNKLDPLVVYVGAAPGNHIPFLAELFPRVRFLLYDGAPFSKCLTSCAAHVEEGRITIVNGMFDDHTAASLVAGGQLGGGGPVLLITDIRCDAKDSWQFENQVARDMKMQQDWLGIIRPEMAMLKFRMPYTMRHGDRLAYTRGTLMHGVWQKPSSGETRLIVKKADIGTTVYYDFQTYEEQLAYHNAYTRTADFMDHVLESRPEFLPVIRCENNPYCACYDCVSELEIYRGYLATCKKAQGVPGDLQKSDDGLYDLILRYASHFTAGVPTFPRSSKHTKFYNLNNNTK
jgi:Poly A polymerase regulatory subunit